MEKIKLSDFKAVSRYLLIDNLFSKVEEKLKGKELEFYSLNGDILKPLIETKKDKGDLEFLYQIIPVISNVDIDVDFKEFVKMTKFPSLTFTSYYKSLLTEISILFKTASKINDLNADVSNTIADLGIDLPVEKTKEEQLEELYAELANVKDDKAKRKEILKQITKLDVDNE